MLDEVTLYSNGTIHTMQNGEAPADALLVRGERIAAVGTREDLLALARGAKRIDLGGCTVIPGFNDSHAHLLPFGLTLDQLDVSADSVSSIADITVAVEGRARRTGEGEWIHGRGYDQNELAECRHITRRELDAASGAHPVVLDHTSGHVLVCNTAALERAGITHDTPNPSGGEIERDQHGDPTGLLKEAAMERLRRVIPTPSEAEGRDAILRAMERLSSFGITSASDAWTGREPSIEPELAMYRSALQSGRLTARVTLMPLISYVVRDSFDEVRLPSDFDTGASPNWLSIGATKIFSDGALSTRTAAMREPYVDDSSNRGILLWERAALVDSMRRAHEAGWQIATHALGDRAVEMVLDCYQEAMRGSPRVDHRHRIEHCMYADENMVVRFGDLGIVPSFTAGHLPTRGRVYSRAWNRACRRQHSHGSLPTPPRRMGIQFRSSCNPGTAARRHSLRNGKDHAQRSATGASAYRTCHGSDPGVHVGRSLCDALRADERDTGSGDARRLHCPVA